MPGAILVASAFLGLFGVLCGLGCAPVEESVAELSVTPRDLALGSAEAHDLRFAWSPSAELVGVSGPPRVFVHLVDDTGELVRTFDHVFPEPWAPGGSVSYSIPIYQSAISPALPPGSYGLEVGLYDAAGRRWPLTVPEVATGKANRVADVAVTDAAEELPTFTFSAAWLPEEIGGDRQILVRRWLAETGNIRVVGVRDPGMLWLRLALPERGFANHRLVLAEGETEATVVVTSGCGDASERLVAGEVRELRLPVDEDCEIVLTPNHLWQGVESGIPRSVALEGIAWMR